MSASFVIFFHISR